jgi:hypothetical protein
LLDDHPTRRFALGFTLHNFAELIQIEISDVVITMPFQIDMQRALAQHPLATVVVYAHHKRPIGRNSLRGCRDQDISNVFHLTLYLSYQMRC